MLAILKLIQSIFKTLHSEGTPRQVAAGIALGACIGLTPLLNLHNLLIISLIACSMSPSAEACWASRSLHRSGSRWTPSSIAWDSAY